MDDDTVEKLCRENPDNAPLIRAMGRNLKSSKQLEKDTNGAWNHRNQCIVIEVQPIKSLESESICDVKDSK